MLDRLQERRGTVDRCEVEEDAAERGAGLVVQLARSGCARPPGRRESLERVARHAS